MENLQSASQKTEWGYELVWASAENYGAKMLVFTHPGKTPFAFTKKQERTWFINSGNIKLRWIDTNKGQLYEAILNEGQTYHVPPHQPVSIEALSGETSVTEVNNGTFEDDKCVILKPEGI